MSRFRKFIISWNNYPDNLSLNDLLVRFNNLACVEYCILSFEVGDIEHTPHIQGYVRFKNAIEFNNVRKQLVNNDGSLGFIDVAKGDDVQNQKYCSKQNNFIEYGIPNVDNSHNSDIANLIDDIIGGVPYVELCRRYYSYVLYHYRDFKTLYQDLSPDF